MPEPAKTPDIRSRYVVGIDLGTTNCGVGYVDTAADAWQVHTFAVPQVVAPSVVEARDVTVVPLSTGPKRILCRRAAASLER